MPHLLLFGPGYCGRAVADALIADGWLVTPVGRATPVDAVRAGLAAATHILSTVAPEGGADRVLAAHAPALAARALPTAYLSSTGVYGDAGGAWVDEGAPLRGRRPERIAAEAGWLALGAAVLRLPGIYGPGRSPIDRVRAGAAHRVAVPDQVFSRVHRDDIVAGVRLALAQGAAGPFNLADDLPCGQNRVVEEACRLLGVPPPPLLPMAEAGLSPAARAFYAENRRVAAGRARRRLGWRPCFPTYREGLRALMATASPATASNAPTPAATLQR